MWEFGVLVSNTVHVTWCIRLTREHTELLSALHFSSCKIILMGENTDAGFCLCVYVNMCVQESDFMSVCMSPPCYRKNLPHLEYVIFLWRPVVGACILKCQRLSFPHYSYYPSPHPPPAWPLGLAQWHHLNLGEMDHLLLIYLQLSDLLPEFSVMTPCTDVPDAHHTRPPPEPACTVLVLGSLPDLTAGGVMGWAPVHVGL